MNRELKFRAWDENIKTMLPPFTLVSLYQAKYRDPDFINFKFMQFTGCFDYKEKEIYQKDILWANDKNWKIVFSNGSFAAWGPGRWRAIPSLWQPVIVGNEYENKDIRCNR